MISDDGSRLFLDDTPIVDNDCQHPPDLRIAAVQLQGGGHHIRVSYFQGPRDCLALVLAIAGPDRHWKVFSTKELKPPPNPEEWRFFETNSAAVVPTTPQEASLAMDQLLRKISGTAAWKSKATGNCLAPPTRSCAR